MKSKNCVWCGKEFTPKSPKQNSCGDAHYKPCADCGQPLLIKESYQNYMKYGPRRCPTCRAKAIGNTRKSKSFEEKLAIKEKTKQTNLERYGSIWAMQNDEIKRKAHDTIFEKYGVDNISQSAEIQDTIRKNSLEKYGVEHYSQNPQIRKNMEDGMLKKFGVKSAMQVPEIRQKAQETVRKRYGVNNVFLSDDIQQKIKETNLNKYGVEYAAQNSEIIQKRIKTNQLKYGASGIVFSDEFLSQLIQDPTKKSEYLSFKNDPQHYILSNFVEKPSFKQISDKIGLSVGQISETLRYLGLLDLVQYKRSTMESEVYEILKSIVPEANIVRNDYSAIKPKEIDLFLPDYNFGIECNPTATHNSSIPFIDDSNILPPSYHQVKSKVCNELGIFLFHLFSYEWEIKRDIIISMFENRLQRTPEVIYARNTKLVELNQTFTSNFLDSYHRQGQMQASVRLGLQDNNGKIVSVMTFNKVRPTIGQKVNDDKIGTWELGRFCNMTHTSVVGGASKLFKHFIETYDPIKVISFSDFARTTGKLYEILGFNYISLSDPGYVWVNYKTDEYYNRVTCQKKNLRKFFNDNTIDIENKTERQIMIEHGFVQVFDSGVIRWEWSKF